MLAVLTVNVIDDPATFDLADNILSLREAVFRAEQDDLHDIIDFDSSIAGDNNMITLVNGQLNITEGLTVLGPGKSLSDPEVYDLVISGNDQSRIFSIFNTDVTLQGLKLSHGKSTPSTSFTPEHGGAIHSIGSDLTLLDSWISDSKAAGLGGGVYVEARSGDEILIQNTVIENNFASVGGGIQFTTLGQNPLLNASIEIIESTVRGNTATPFFEPLDSSTGEWEPGLYPEVTANGGGVSFEGPFAPADGSSDFLISRSTISENTAYTHGGGLSLEYFGGLQIVNSTVSGNRAVASGGGMSLPDSFDGTRISHSTIVDNEVGFDMSLHPFGGPIFGAAGAKGGGLSLIGDGSTGETLTEIDHTIVAGNRDLWDNLDNPLDANTADIQIGHGALIVGTVVTQQLDAPYSLLGVVMGGFDSSHASNPNGVVPAIVSGTGVIVVGTGSAGLGQLADNGGPTMTHALFIDSQAVDAGDPIFSPTNVPVIDGTPITTDQRGAGFVRVADGDGDLTARIDIGAFESQDLTTDAPRITDVIISGTGSLHEDYSFAVNDAVGSGEQIRTVPVGGADTISVRFDKPVIATVDSLDLMSFYAGLTYNATLTGSGTTLLVWTFDTPFTADKLNLHLDDTKITDLAFQHLDGEWLSPFALNWTGETVSSFPSGDGVEGGGFNFFFTILPGDFNGDNVIDNLDLAIWEEFETDQNWLFSMFFGDADGDGDADQDDLDIWNANFNLGLDFSDWS